MSRLYSCQTSPHFSSSGIERREAIGEKVSGRERCISRVFLQFFLLLFFFGFLLFNFSKKKDFEQFLIFLENNINSEIFRIIRSNINKNEYIILRYFFKLTSNLNFESNFRGTKMNRGIRFCPKC